MPTCIKRQTHSRRKILTATAASPITHGLLRLLHTLTMGRDLTQTYPPEHPGKPCHNPLLPQTCNSDTPPSHTPNPNTHNNHPNIRNSLQSNTLRHPTPIASNKIHKNPRLLQQEQPLLINWHTQTQLTIRLSQDFQTHTTPTHNQSTQHTPPKKTQTANKNHNMTTAASPPSTDNQHASPPSKRSIPKWSSPKPQQHNSTPT